MRSWLQNILLLLIVGSLSACQLIAEGDRLIEVPVAVEGESRHVLVEFTGFRCVNCPKASAEAESLKQSYGDRLIVVAMHPATNPFTQGAAQYDYTCEAADTYYTLCGGTAATPMPTGCVDLAEEQGNYLSDYSEWPALVAARMAQPATAHLSTTLQNTADEQAVQVRVTAYAGEPIASRMMAWIVEDSVPGAQALPDGTVDMHYYHRHMLRGAVGDPMGEELPLSAAPKERQLTAVIPDKCNRKYCSIVVALTDSRGAIIAAQQMKLTN